MNILLLILVLAFVWATITGAFTLLNLLLGAGIGAAAVLLLRAYLAPPRALRQVRRALSLAGLFLRELFMSALRVAAIVLRPDMRRTLRPAIVAVPLDVKSNAEITLLANLITLTPGTLSTVVSEDRTKLFVHVLTLESREALIADIKNGFEKKVMEVFAQ
ncbi:cation:proton antiporter [Devosia geojensis]|uniref:Cation:proton antiporter n=1 Tax=Devosia geojensis TaxID=443610 RepID=A0A0F5FSU9_9HYPH|nr:Na+/H+ antiporter subunit E [Devosia geojensis]KKB11635.1 cation:proton antiporter [Devosia geojensis]